MIARTYQYLAAFLVVAALTFSPATAQELKPDVDISRVTSWSAYEVLMTESFVRYDNRVTQKFTETEKGKTSRFRAYSEARIAALRELRQADMPKYLEWLDAKELGEHDKVHGLETSVPALVAFKKKDGEAYAIYAAEKAAFEKEYAAFRAAARKVYKEEKRLLKEAYDARSGKKT